MNPNRSMLTSISLRTFQAAAATVAAISTIMLPACSTSQTTTESAEGISTQLREADVASAQIPQPRAVAYRTSGDCPELVPVTLTSSGKALLSFPAPSDLTSDSEPVELANGWWLDRRGISASSRFTTYTYSQYRALAQPPSPGELLSHLDTECVITDIRQLPMSLTEALADTAAVNKILRGGDTYIPGTPVATPYILK